MHIGSIVDCLQEQRFVALDDLIEEGKLSVDSPQPNPSMKGRTPRSLLRQLAEWQARLRRLPKVVEFRWRRSSIGDFRLPIEGDGRRC